MWKTLEPITDKVWRGGQSWNFHEVLIHHPNGKLATKLRIRIKRDAYDEQSWAKIERWGLDRWHEVHSLSGHDKLVKALPSYIVDRVNVRNFDDVRTELLQVALAIIA